MNSHILLGQDGKNQDSKSQDKSIPVCQSHKLFDFDGRAVGFGWGRHLPLPPTFPQAGFGHKKRFPVGSARTARALWGLAAVQFILPAWKSVESLVPGNSGSGFMP